MFWTILFYAVCAVGALLFVGLLYYRIDWARHPEKYKDLENDEKEKGPAAARKEGQGQGKGHEAAKAAGQGEPLPCRGREKAAGSELKREKVTKNSSVSYGGIFMLIAHREPGAEEPGLYF